MSTESAHVRRTTEPDRWRVLQARVARALHLLPHSGVGAHGISVMAYGVDEDWTADVRIFGSYGWIALIVTPDRRVEVDFEYMLPRGDRSRDRLPWLWPTARVSATGHGRATASFGHDEFDGAAALVATTFGTVLSVADPDDLVAIGIISGLVSAPDLLSGSVRHALLAPGRVPLDVAIEELLKAWEDSRSHTFALAQAMASLGDGPWWREVQRTSDSITAGRLERVLKRIGTRGEFGCFSLSLASGDGGAGRAADRSCPVVGPRA